MRVDHIPGGRSYDALITVKDDVEDEVDGKKARGLFEILTDGIAIESAGRCFGCHHRCMIVRHGFW